MNKSDVWLRVVTAPEIEAEDKRQMHVYVCDKKCMVGFYKAVKS